MIYEQSAARTVRGQEEKRWCDWSCQPLKIEQLHSGAQSAQVEDSTPGPRHLSLPRCPLRVRSGRRERAEQSVPRFET